MGYGRDIYTVLVEKPEGNKSLRRSRSRWEVDWRIILRWINRNWNVEAWTGSSWLRIRTGGEHL